MGTASSVGKPSPSVCSILPLPAASTSTSASRAYEVGHTEVVGMTLYLAQIEKEKCKMLAEK